MEKDFLHIIDQHQGIIYKVCKLYRTYKDEQEDLFQDIVLQLWRAYPKFRGESKVSTWIYRIAINTAINSFRKKMLLSNYRSIYPLTTGTLKISNPQKMKRRCFR